MADLNALIAQGYQFQAPPDPFAQYAKMQQLGQGQQANQLNQMKMQEYQQAADERNALRQLNPSSADYESQLFKVNPQLGIAYRKEAAGAAAQKSAGAASDAAAAAAKQKMIGQAQRDISGRPSDANITAWMEDVQESPLYSPAEKASVVKRASDLIAMPFADRQIHLAQQGATAAELKPAAPAAVSNLARLQNELAALPQGDPRRAQYLSNIRKETEFAPAASTTIKMAPQESAFESSLGTGQSKKILDSKTAAEDASQILQTNEVGRSLLKSGAITGKGADFLVGLNAGLKQAGIDFGYADAAANSQAYGAAMAANTGNLIKQFGAGTAISDADRAYATKAAAGEITMDETAIRKVLDINDRAARNVIGKHNKSVKGIKTNIPLEVEMPTIAAPQLSGAGKIPGSASAATPLPQAAIDALKAGRGTDAQFDEMFGAGAAKRARGGK